MGGLGGEDGGGCETGTPYSDALKSGISQSSAENAGSEYEPPEYESDWSPNAYVCAAGCSNSTEYAEPAASRAA